MQTYMHASMSLISTRTVAYPGFGRICPKYYAHAHNMAGRGPAHVNARTADATGTGRQDNSALALCVRVASARAYPRAFVGFRWPPTVAGSFG